MKIDKKIIITGTIVLTLVLILVAYFVFFTKEEYKIIYNVDGGNSIKSTVVKEDELYKLPVPKKDGYIFAGWLNEEDEIVAEEIKITDNLILKATWISEEATVYEVSFETDGGSKVESIMVEKGLKLNLPTEPTKDGYKFIDWIDDEGKVVSKDFIVKEDIELKATWEKNASSENEKEPVKETEKVPEKETEKVPEKETETIKPVAKEYYCEEGYTLEGTKCTKEVKTKVSTKTSCPDGTSPVDGKCQKKVDHICLNEEGDQGVYAYTNDEPTCFYGAPQNNQDQAECNNEFYGAGGYFYDYGCYPTKETGTAALDAKQCPRGAREVLLHKFKVCMIESDEISQEYCTEGKLIEHAVDGNFCSVTKTVDAKTR